MQYVLSLLSCRSVTTSPCARSLLSISSPVLTLNSATLPDSCPVMMMLGCAVNAQTVALDPMGWNIYLGSLGSKREILAEPSQICQDSIQLTFGAVVGIQVKNANCTLVAHPLLGDANDLISVVIKSNSFYCGRKLPGEEAFPS